jgi:DNA-directed RNA polymerase subunit L
MELKVLHKTKTELELEIIDENETILNPITHKLTAIEDVDYAAYLADHPHANSRRLFIRVKKGDPKKILQQVIKELHTELTKFEKEVFATKSKK